MQFLLLWLLAGVVASIFQMLFMPTISHIRAAIPRRIYLAGLTIATAPLVLAFFLTMAFTEWLETASLRAAWVELRENLECHHEGIVEAWHGR